MKMMIAGCGESRSGWQMKVLMRPSGVAISIGRSIIKPLLLCSGTDRDPGPIAIRDRFDFEILGRCSHARHRLRESHGRLGIPLLGSVKAHGIDAGGHVVA